MCQDVANGMFVIVSYTVFCVQQMQTKLIIKMFKYNLSYIFESICLS